MHTKIKYWHFVYFIESSSIIFWHSGVNTVWDLKLSIIHRCFTICVITQFTYRECMYTHCPVCSLQNEVEGGAEGDESLVYLHTRRLHVEFTLMQVKGRKNFTRKGTQRNVYIYLIKKKCVKKGETRSPGIEQVEVYGHCNIQSADRRRERIVAVGTRRDEWSDEGGRLLMETYCSLIKSLSCRANGRSTVDRGREKGTHTLAYVNCSRAQWSTKLPCLHQPAKYHTLGAIHTQSNSFIFRKFTWIHSWKFYALTDICADKNVVSCLKNIVPVFCAKRTR